jgi:hypothetical protein
MARVETMRWSRSVSTFCENGRGEVFFNFLDGPNSQWLFDPSYHKFDSRTWSFNEKCQVKNHFDEKDCGSWISVGTQSVVAVEVDHKLGKCLLELKTK